MRKYSLLVLMLLLLSVALQAQQVAFDAPKPLLSKALSDKGAATSFFNNRYYVSWKEPGTVAQLHLAQSSDLQTGFSEVALPGLHSIATPALAAGKALYLFWISEDSTLNYGLLAADPEKTTITALPLPGDAATLKCTSGITAAITGDKIILATHAANKDRLNILVCTPAPGGILQQVTVSDIKGARSATYPTVVYTHNKVRCCYTRSGRLYSQDYDAAREEWTKPQEQPGTTAVDPPAMATAGTDLLYIWRDKNQQGQWRYRINVTTTDLPRYFETTQPVSLASGDSGLVMTYNGTNGQLYWSRGRVYHPASWMEELLLPGREAYTLKDIVLPGAHDAGMSVLNGVGGKSTYTINECNTLTQLLPVQQQLEAGMRMFDLRIDFYLGALYAKHAPSDCMDDAVGGGYGERLDSMLTAVKRFLGKHNKEIVILSFCHFCNRRMPVEQQAKTIVALLGRDLLFDPGSRPLQDIPLRELAGKVILSFEDKGYADQAVLTNTMTNDMSAAFFNYRRAYAATNIPDSLFAVEKRFFNGLKEKTAANDIVRLDWQLTQIGQEAAFTCGQFQSENGNLLLDATLLVTNTIKKNKSIISLAQLANGYLTVKVVDWLQEGIISRDNKPNILYVDAAGSWITDFCIFLNNTAVYKK